MTKHKSSKDEISLNYTMSVTSKPKRSIGGVDSDYTKNNSRPKSENFPIKISKKMNEKISNLKLFLKERAERPRVSNVIYL